jgi:hypothetical protein
MPRVRFLESVYLIPHNQVFHYNDELDIEDEKLIKHLSDRGHIDVLLEEENGIEQEKKTTRKRQAKKDEE